MQTSHHVPLQRQQSAGYMVNWVARLLTPAIDRRLKPLGLSSAYLPVFFALGDGRSLPQKALAAMAAVEQPTMAATLNRMERDGLILRKPDPADGRSALVCLTKRALGKVDAVHGATREVNELALSALDEQDAQQLLSLLERMAATLAEDGTLARSKRAATPPGR